MLRREGLEKIIVGAAAHGVDGDRDVVNRGDDDDGEIGVQSVNAFQQVDAVDIRHQDVGEHQIAVVELESFEGLAPPAGLRDGASMALERCGNHGAHMGFIVNDQNAHRLLRGLPGAGNGCGLRAPGLRQPWFRTPAFIFF